MTDQTPNRIIIAFDAGRHPAPILVGSARNDKHAPLFYQVIKGSGAVLADEVKDAVSAGADGVFLYGSIDPDKLARVSIALSVGEAEAGKIDGSTRIAVLIESALDLTLTGRILQTDARLSWIGIDPLRVAIDLGVTVDALPVVVAKAQLVIAAKAAQVPAYEAIPDALFDAMRRRQSAADGFAAILASLADDGRSI